MKQGDDMNRIRGLAYVIKHEGKERTINGYRMVYGHYLSNTPRENVFLGLSHLEKDFPEASFTFHKTWIKKDDCLMPIKNKKGNWMWT